jgi:hypothetical protein
VFVMGSIRRHWTSRTAHALVDFYIREWKWIIPVVISTLGLIVALAKIIK